MCKLSAAKGSKWAKNPPCEWLASTPSLVTQAQKEQGTRIEKWGEYFNDADKWPQVPMEFKQVVYAQFFMASEKKAYKTLGTVVGVYRKSTTDAVYHLSFVLHGRVYYGYCKAEHVKPSGEETSDEGKDFAPSPRLKPPKKGAKESAPIPTVSQQESPAVTGSAPESAPVPTPAVFSVGTRVFVEEFAGVGVITAHVRHNKRIDAYKVSYRDQPDFQKGQPEVAEHSCDQVFWYMEKEAWMTKAIKRSQRVYCVRGFNARSGISAEYTGYGNVVGLCVDVCNRPRFYAVFMNFAIAEVFYFDVADVKECEQIQAAEGSAQPAAGMPMSAPQAAASHAQKPATVYSSKQQAAAEADAADRSESEQDQGDGGVSANDQVQRGGTGAGSPHVATGGGKGKHTHWIHSTRMACLRLIHSQNPFASRDSGLIWQQIAEELHRSTQGVTDTNARGKVKDCQVHSNGQSVMMWFRRQLEEMDKDYSDQKERSTSGQGGQRDDAIGRAAKKTGESAENIQKKWELLASLKSLQEDALKEAKSRKDTSAALKELKDGKIPDAVEKMACESSQVMLGTIKELQRRKRIYEQRAATLQGANRMPMMTDIERKEFEMLDRLIKKRRETAGDEGLPVQDSTDGQVTGEKPEGRGKSSMYKESFQNMSVALEKLTTALDDDRTREEPVTAANLTHAFQKLDAAIAAGLVLEAGERQFIREQYLRRFARI